MLLKKKKAIKDLQENQENQERLKVRDAILKYKEESEASNQCLSCQNRVCLKRRLPELSQKENPNLDVDIYRVKETYYCEESSRMNHRAMSMAGVLNLLATGTGGQYALDCPFYKESSME